VVQAAEMIGARVSDKITLNITVGYGEVDGWTLSSGSAAAGTSTPIRAHSAAIASSRPGWLT
jgi:hypothetical protein